ncbi:glycosyltransferase family 1 protein [Neobacillus sp. MM2021_6]|uniref:glycosyltransferase family 1 protein n=1 Tax=Bacillaceae TaxID=186817 RepID=UPI00140D9571|nr:MULTISPECIES: glycosyltransferase family 1 protein [Bacillaceae]MBO0958854.1 glycosyltransferase family 1 protein [Neobacillus sp. MM2021_6]NHC21319.1 glycosyltransferase family 1 protein [Bacillus sp. MM2020_4]
MERGGAETLIMNIYRNLDRSKIQFDFISHSNKQGDYEKEILELGGRIFKIPSLGQLGPFAYLKELVKIMSANSFIAVHSHTDFQGGFPALAAKISGVKKRICHSHSTNWNKGNRYSEKWILRVLQTIIKFSATHYCSCSNEAAEFLFGKHILNKGKVSILKNGINLTQFSNIDINSKESVFDELELPRNSRILGHVGRFSDSKNHMFILKILKKLVDEDNCFVALLIGDGPLKESIEKEAERLGVLKNIRLLGVREDIPRLMKAFDVFLFPSQFEGFGIVALEAQCAGTPCVISDAVPQTTDMGLGLTSYVSLDKGIEIWCSEVKAALNKERPDSRLINEKISNRGYNIENNLNNWIDLYGAS